uniref:Glucosylceramidase n=1 Tax=Acrobeloides nanus TaxID=290746 RepID=A0A914EDM0_9BILA
MVLDYTNTVFGDQDAFNMVDGLAVHWYADDNASPTILSEAHAKLNGKWMLYTEACNGGPDPGQWIQGDRYMQHIMAAIQNWVTGWVDWNICLDPSGGPNWVGNLVDAPILVSNTTDEFEKQPMYYALGHLA